MTLILAHDLGTTGNKAVLMDERGQLVDSAFAPYPTAHPEPLAAEQDPEDWWGAVIHCTRALLDADPNRRADLAVVGFSGHMNGVVLVDDEGNPVRPALIHADVRALQPCNTLQHRLPESGYYATTGNRLAPFYSLPKLMMLLQRESNVVQRARWMLQCKDYCAARLTDTFGYTDPSDASLTGIYDINTLRWSEEIIESSGIPPRLLPQVVPSTTVLGRVSASAAQETGLPQGLPVVIGAGDGACATVGAGAVEPGACYNYVGGTAWISCVRDRFTPDAQMRLTTLMSAQPQRWVQFGTVQSAGSAWDWFVRLFGKGRVSAALQAEAKAVSPGSEGLLFLPYLSGERAPIWNPQAKGVFMGLQAHHTRAHLARAVLEGVAASLASILQIMRETGATAEVILVVGGGTRSVLWMRILADMYGSSLAIPMHAESSTALGAAIIAGIGVELYEDFAVAKQLASIQQYVEPHPENSALYLDLRHRSVQIYEALRPLFE